MNSEHINLNLNNEKKLSHLFHNDHYNSHPYTSRTSSYPNTFLGQPPLNKQQQFISSLSSQIPVNTETSYSQKHNPFYFNSNQIKLDNCLYNNLSSINYHYSNVPSALLWNNQYPLNNFHQQYLYSYIDNNNLASKQSGDVTMFSNKVDVNNLKSDSQKSFQNFYNGKGQETMTL